MALVDVVKFNGLATRDWIVYKHYAEDLSTATQLIVGEGQVAVLVKGGRICDVFGPGSYRLETKNIPILSAFVNLPYGGRTPFTAEVYYINAVTKLDINWGTTDPIQLIDPKYHIKLRVRAFGQVGLRIRDYAMFLRELIGSLSASEIVSYDKVMGFYKGFLISKIKTCIARVILEEGISALEISARLDTISDRIKALVAEDFDRFGMRLINFYVKSVNFPDEDFERINSILEDKAAFDIMGDSRYITKRSFDVYEGAATNENGVAGAFAAGGIGIGAGAAVSSGVMNAGGVINTSGSSIDCPKCGRANNRDSKFCCECGAPLHEESSRIACPSCGAMIAKDSKFCSSCGHSLAARTCSCGAELEAGARFCSSCGRKVGE